MNGITPEMQAHIESCIHQSFDKLHDEIKSLREEKGSAFGKWIALAQVIVTVCLVPWGTWVTSTIQRHENDFTSIKSWQSSRSDVLENERLKTIQTITALIESKFGQIQGVQSAQNQQLTENCYQVRRLGEIMQEHMRNGAVSFPPSKGKKEGDLW